MSIARYRQAHAGKSIAILGNGPSLAANGPRLSQLKRTIGTNRSHVLHDATYHMILEREHATQAPEVFAKMAKAGRLFVAGGENTWEFGHVIPILNGGVKFSRDLVDGVVTQIGTAGSVVYAAIQLAAWMGCKPIYLVGVDLFGDHFDGSPASKRLGDQNSLFQYVPADVEVWVAGSPESKAVFPKVEWEAMR